MRDLDAGLDLASTTCPSVFPWALRSPKFLEQLQAQYSAVVKHLPRLRAHLWSRPEWLMIGPHALSLEHLSFWEQEASEVPEGLPLLECGIHEWRSVACVPVAQVLASLLHTGDQALLCEHERGLLARFVDQVAQEGGPAFDLEELQLQLKMAQFEMLRAACARLPLLYSFHSKAGLRRVKSLRDPVLQDDVVRPRVLDVVNAFHTWRDRGVYAALRSWHESAGLRLLVLDLPAEYLIQKECCLNCL